MRRVRSDYAAYHEAGHAVAAWNLQLKFKSVAVGADRNSVCHLIGAESADWFTREIAQKLKIRVRAEAYIVILIAGQIAECKFRGTKFLKTRNPAEVQCAMNLAINCCGTVETAKKFLDFQLAAARDLIDANWWAVEAVAGALIEKPEMNLAEYLSVVRKCQTKRRGLSSLPVVGHSHDYEGQAATQLSCGDSSESVSASKSEVNLSLPAAHPHRFPARSENDKGWLC